MNATAKDGGPAFPSVLYSHDRAENWSTDGMSLRDYFAIHCDQPGEAEIIIAAGLKAKSTAGFTTVFPDGTEKTFTAWWLELPQPERFKLYAKVRYGIADAMLAARAS